MLKCFAFFALILNLGQAQSFAAEPKPGIIDFKLHGFTIEPLEDLADTTSPILFMHLPNEEGFSANVNIRVENYPQGIEKYIELSREQFKQHKFEVVSETLGNNSVIFEYKGSVLGNDLHFYGKATQKQNKIYLVTGTAKETQWEKLGPKLKKTVDSFQLTPQ